jgi:hypothetical protein
MIRLKGGENLAEQEKDTQELCVPTCTSLNLLQLYQRPIAKRSTKKGATSGGGEYEYCILKDLKESSRKGMIWLVG